MKTLRIMAIISIVVTALATLGSLMVMVDGDSSGVIYLVVNGFYLVFSSMTLSLVNDVLSGEKPE